MSEQFDRIPPAQTLENHIAQVDLLRAVQSEHAQKLMALPGFMDKILHDIFYAHWLSDEAQSFYNPVVSQRITQWPETNPGSPDEFSVETSVNITTMPSSDPNAPLPNDPKPHWSPIAETHSDMTLPMVTFTFEEAELVVGLATELRDLRDLGLLPHLSKNLMLINNYAPAQDQPE